MDQPVPELSFPALPGVVNEPLRADVDGAVEKELLPEYPPRLLEKPWPPEYPFAKASVAPNKVNVSIKAMKTELIETKRFIPFLPLLLSYLDICRKAFLVRKSQFNVHQMNVHVMDISQKLTNRINQILLVHEVFPVTKHSVLQNIGRYSLTLIVPEIDLKMMRRPSFPLAAKVTGAVDDFLGI
ncbi:hypothetical protein O9H85_32620 [Paenibacillus filicis]|uniref:Uncharacterized protein n=1 Tax=Paenibacillus gyeongsangnamensis TaxID=3388067 RepID=A0ABT4QJH8_9BACL|nr:hypothetical protein [Paenibacillus filicis]MCZ8517018.1 hypothetical protein [Paenibacillus filicis]